MYQLQRVTITPIHSHGAEEVKYSLRVFGDCPDLWTEPGLYDTAEEAVASFCIPLKEELERRIVETLYEGKQVSFSLQDAFDF